MQAADQLDPGALHHKTFMGQGEQSPHIQQRGIPHREPEAGEAVSQLGDVLRPTQRGDEPAHLLRVGVRGLVCGKGCFPARGGQILCLDEDAEHGKVGQGLRKAQQIEQRHVLQLLPGAQVEHQRPQQVGGKGPDMQDMEQHHKAARNDRMGHPEQGRNEAEQKINGFGDGGHRGRDRQRDHSGGGTGTVLPAGREDEGRCNAQIAKGLGEAGVHPDDAVREGQAHGVLGHADGVSTCVGHRAYGQAAAQRRELEGHIDEVMQAGGDEQPFQKAVEEHTRVP